VKQMKGLAGIRPTKLTIPDPGSEVSGPIVVSRPDRIGDVVISTSSLQPLREKFPTTEIYFLAAEPMRPLLENHPLLTGFIPLSGNLTGQLKAISPSIIVHLHPDPDCYLAGEESGIPFRIGYGESGRYLTHAIPDRRAEGLKHEGEYCFDLLELLRVDKPEKLTPSIHLRETDKQSLQSKLPWNLETTRFAIVAATAYSSKKEWPTDRFIAVSDKLQSEFNLQIAFVGADPDRIIEGRLDLSGQTNLGELGWLLSYAKALVANDSGTAHLAAAVDCPSVIIFGRTDPRYGPVRWRPLLNCATIITSFTRRKLFEPTRACWRRSFAAIEVETVTDALGKILMPANTPVIPSEARDLTSYPRPRSRD
jgi:heptosyltransferase II